MWVCWKALSWTKKFVLICLLWTCLEKCSQSDPARQGDFIYFVLHISYHKYLNYYWIFSLHLYVDYRHIHISLRYNLFTLKCRFLLLRTFSISPLFFVLSFPFCNSFILLRMFSVQFWYTPFCNYNLLLFFLLIYLGVVRTVLLLLSHLLYLPLNIQLLFVYWRVDDVLWRMLHLLLSLLMSMDLLLMMLNPRAIAIETKRK